jgi:hypothetical protein
MRVDGLLRTHSNERGDSSIVTFPPVWCYDCINEHNNVKDTLYLTSLWVDILGQSVRIHTDTCEQGVPAPFYW